jgi:hypothetical protein
MIANAGAPSAADAAAPLTEPGVLDAGAVAFPSRAQAVLDGAAARPDGAAAFMDLTPSIEPVGAPLSAVPIPGETPGMDPAALAPAQDGSLLDALAEYSPAARVLVSAAVISSLIGAQAASGGTGGARRIAFTNARLVPCLVKASLERQIETLSLAVTRGGGAAAAALHGGGGSGGGIAGGHDQPTVERLFEQVSQGFHDVVSDLPRELRDGGPADGFTDSRLMTQIGMLLGFVYLGFLTVWFWATRRSQEGRT